VPYVLQEGLPTEIRSDFDPGIFHDPKHLALQSPKDWLSFFIQDNNASEIKGAVYFNLKDHEAKSAVKSPFGSFLFSDSVSRDQLVEFVQFVESELKNAGTGIVLIKNQPQTYSKKNEMLHEVMLECGYAIGSEETSAVISVTDKSFESGLHKSEKKRLRKCRENDLVFEIMLLTQLQKIYIFLEACRKEKGYALSMTFNEIQELVRVFPERVILTTVISKNQIIAANISIRVYDHVLYNFYHDHASEYDHLSPVVLLNEGLYQFCQENKIQLLDLGTSNIVGELNESLLNFKLNLGAKPSTKLTFTKKIV
jgi:hypothetical protein